MLLPPHIWLLSPGKGKTTRQPERMLMPGHMRWKGRTPPGSLLYWWRRPVWRIWQGAEAATDCRLLNIMQEVSRVWRHIEQHQKNENPPNYTLEGLPTLLIIITFPINYLGIVLPRLPPAKLEVIHPQAKYTSDVTKLRLNRHLPFNFSSACESKPLSELVSFTLKEPTASFRNLASNNS